MPGEDWTSYELHSAPRGLLCQFRRQDGFAFTGYAKDFFPEFNVAGLEWKLTGIAKEQLERMPEAVLRQMMPQENLLTMLLVTWLMGACGRIPGVGGMKL